MSVFALPWQTFLAFATISLHFYFQSLSSDESKRQHMIAQLYSDEMTFRNELRHGIQQYVQPLDVGIVTQEQHEMLFQNIEQVFDLLNELSF